MTAVLGQVEQPDRLRRLAARECERADAAVESGHPLLEDRLGRVHDAGVDVAELGEPEQRRRMRGVPEDVARRLVDRHGPGPGRRVGHGSGVDLSGLETPVGHVRDLLRRRVRQKRAATALRHWDGTGQYLTGQVMIASAGIGEAAALGDRCSWRCGIVTT